MAFARTVTHTKTLISPSTGSADLVYGADYVSATSHTAAVSGATSGGIPYFDSTTSEACSALLASGGVVLGGGAGGAPNTSANLTFDGTKITIGNASATGLLLGAGAATAVAIQIGTNANMGFYTGSITGIGVSYSGTGVCRFILGASSGGAISAASGAIFGWESSTVGSGNPDTAFNRVSAGVVGVSTGANNTTTGTIQGKHNSSDGTAGATAGPFTVITAITVKDGLVTSLTGS